MITYGWIEGREACPRCKGKVIVEDCPVCLKTCEHRAQGHLSRWMQDTCDMQNEGDRLAMEQYQATLAALHHSVNMLACNTERNKKQGHLPCHLCRLGKAALKAAEGE